MTTKIAKPIILTLTGFFYFISYIIIFDNNEQTKYQNQSKAEVKSHKNKVIINEELTYQKAIEEYNRHNYVDSLILFTQLPQDSVYGRYKSADQYIEVIKDHLKELTKVRGDTINKELENLDKRASIVLLKKGKSLLKENKRSLASQYLKKAVAMDNQNFDAEILLDEISFKKESLKVSTHWDREVKKLFVVDLSKDIAVFENYKKILRSYNFELFEVISQNPDADNSTKPKELLVKLKYQKKIKELLDNESFLKYEDFRQNFNRRMLKETKRESLVRDI